MNEQRGKGLWKLNRSWRPETSRRPPGGGAGRIRTLKMWNGACGEAGEGCSLWWGGWGGQGRGKSGVVVLGVHAKGCGCFLSPCKTSSLICTSQSDSLEATGLCEITWRLFGETERKRVLSMRSRLYPPVSGYGTRYQDAGKGLPESPPTRVSTKDFISFLFFLCFSTLDQHVSKPVIRYNLLVNVQFP